MAALLTLALALALTLTLSLCRGWGWRLSLAMLTQCVPVIIQPNVTQPFEELLPYDDFSLRLQVTVSAW